MRGPFRLLVVLLVALAAPHAQAQEAHAVDANVIVYHVHPDPRADASDADPFSTPRAPGISTGRVPLTRFDGVLDAADAPEGDPASVPAHFREMQRLLLLRERVGAPLTLHVEGAREPDALVVRARAIDVRDDAPPFELRATLVEDPLAHEGASGIRTHRFVARAELEATNGTNATWRVPINATWDATRLIVIVHARALDDGEALQSARWSPSQQAPTVQTRKAVLIERVTATWCSPCAPSDNALSLLAAQTGSGFLAQGDGLGYARSPGALAIIGMAGGLGGAWWLDRRRRA